MVESYSNHVHTNKALRDVFSLINQLQWIMLKLVR